MRFGCRLGIRAFKRLDSGTRRRLVGAGYRRLPKLDLFDGGSSKNHVAAILCLDGTTDLLDLRGRRIGLDSLDDMPDELAERTHDRFRIGAGHLVVNAP
jgi:hypothetical protein